MINHYKAKRLEISQIIAPYKETAIENCGLSKYSVETLLTGRNNYPVSSLTAFCYCSGLVLVMVDLTTLDRFACNTTLEVHRTIALLMERYAVDAKYVYRQTAKHYTAPETNGSSENANAALSIDTLLAVCEALHCELRIEPR